MRASVLGASCSLFLLVSTAVVAAPHEWQPGAKGAPSALVARAIHSRPLFYGFAGGPKVAKIESVELSVSIDGRPYLRETITAPAGWATGATVELLGGDRPLLDRLYELAATKTHAFTVTVRADGRDLRTFSFADFVRCNEDVKQRPLHIFSQKGRVDVLDPSARPAPPLRNVKAPGWVLQGSCSDSCWTNYNLCQEEGCVYQDDCDSCHVAYSSCMSSCWICSPDTTPTESSELIGAVFTGTECVDGTLRYHYYATYRIYHGQNVDYCGMHSSYEFLYSEDVSGFISEDSHSPC
jgi:hypothetical protein